MSLCPMSWTSVKRLSRETNMTFVHASAHHNHDVIAVDPLGNCYWLRREKGKVVEVQPSLESTTTAAWLRGEAHARLSDENIEELRVRIAELSTGLAP